MCSALISLIEQGQDAEFVSSLRAFRLATGEAVYATFHSGAKDTAQAISDLLDGVNTCVEALELYLQPPEPPAPVEVAPPVPEQANGGDEEVPLPPPVLPDESFFLPPAALTEILTISVDPSLLRRPSSAPRDWGLVEEPAPTRGRGRGRGRRGRPRGRGRGGVAAGGLGLKRPAMPSVWTPELQRYLAGALLVALTPPSAPIPDGVDVTSMPANVAEFMNELQESGASEGLRQMGATLPGVRATLQAGGYVEPEEFVGAMHAEAHDAAETYLTLQNPDTRRGKVIGAADSFCNLLSSMLDVLLAEFGAAAKAARLAKADEEGMAEAAYAAEVAAMAPIVNLPKSIQANREPYRHGDWRKTPFVPRPYVQLQEYYIVEEASREAITRKLSTTKGGGCDGQHCGTRDELGTYSLEADGFQTRCECLSRNTECDHTCGCEGGGQCLNRSVTRRETVVLGQDAEEINSWGMDCYTRRNIQDGEQALAFDDSLLFGQRVCNQLCVLVSLELPRALPLITTLFQIHFCSRAGVPGVWRVQDAGLHHHSRCRPPARRSHRCWAARRRRRRHPRRPRSCGRFRRRSCCVCCHCGHHHGRSGDDPTERPQHHREQQSVANPGGTGAP